MEREFEVQARCRFNGEDLWMEKIIARIDLEEVMPPRSAVLDPMDLVRVQQAAERRRRLVDMIAAEFAHTLTEALFKKARG
jgi:hypothetical protein